MPQGQRVAPKSDEGGRVAWLGARCWAMTEIKLRRTPHSLPRRSNSPRRNAVKTRAKTGAFLESVPAVSAKLKAPVTADRKFEEVVKSAQDAAVLVLVY
jgi:hypothetical protein